MEIEKVKNSESSSDSKIASASSSMAEELSSLSYGGFDFQTKELRDQFQSYVENKFINDVIIANGFDIPLPLFRDESGQDVLQNSAVWKKLESSRENACVQKTQEWLENNYQTIWKEARKLQGLPNDSEAYMWFMAGKKSKTMIEEGTKQMALGALTELAGVGIFAVGSKALSVRMKSSFIPFKGKTNLGIEKMFKLKGFEAAGRNSLFGKGGYKNLKTGTSYHIDPGNVYRRGTELPHVDVNHPKGSSFPKRKFPLGDKLYE